MRALVLLLVGVLLVAGVLVWTSGDDAVDRDGTSGRGAAADVTPEPLLRGTGEATLHDAAGPPGEAEPARTLTLTIRARSGRPVPEARVAWVAGYSDPVAWRSAGRADAEGCIRLSVGAGDARVRVHARGFARRTVRIDEERSERLIVLAPSGTLSGRVLDAGTGEPVAGVAVFAAQGERRLRNSLDEDDPRGVSDAEGRYVLAGARAGPVTVYAFGDGWVSERLLDVDCTSGFDPLLAELPAGGTVEQDLPVIPAGRVGGLVVDADGVPLEGAGARALQFDGSRGGCGSNAIMADDFPFVPDPPPTLTDAGGRYLLATLLPGVTYQVDGWAEGFERAHERANVGPGEVAAVDFVLEAREQGYFLDLEVYDRVTGAPIEGAMLQHGVTDESGRARVGPLRGWGRWGVGAPGYFRTHLEVSPPDDLTGPAPSRREVVHLDPAASVAGQVLTPDGTPADGAVVRLGEPVDLTARWHGTTEYVGPDGRFAFGRLDPAGGAVRLFAAWEREGRVYRGEVTADLGAEDVTIPLVLEAIDPSRAPREILLTDAAGRPAHRAYIRVHFEPPARNPRLRPGSPWDGARLQDGSFLLAPSWTPFRIEIAEAARGDEARTPLGALLLGPFDGTVDVPGTIALPPAGRIEGRVLDEAGLPVPGLEVTARVLRDPWPEREEQPPSLTHATSHTDRAGRFDLEALGDFVYAVRVLVPARFRRPEITEVRPGGPPLEIRLGTAHRCTVAVLDPDGLLLERAYFRISYRGGEHGTVHVLTREIVTREGGRHVLEGLSPERTYILEVHPPHKRTDLAAVSVDPWIPRDTTVQLLPSASVEGVVVDPAGRPIARACVIARPAVEGAPAYYEYDYTDESGRFRLAEVPPGRTRLSLECSPFHEPSVRDVEVPCGPVRLVAPSGRRVDVRFDPPPRGMGRLGWRLVGTRWDGKEAVRDGRSDEAPDILRLGHLPPDVDFDLLIELHHAGLVGLAHVSASDAGVIDVALVPSVTLTGRLIHPAGGSRVPEGDVHLHLGRLSWKTGTEADGTFALSGLPRGTGTLRARVNLDGTWYAGHLEVGVGSEQVPEIQLTPEAE